MGTRKPCPCCKQVCSARKADSICCDCQRKIEDYERLKNLLKAQQTDDMMEILIGLAPNCNQYYYLPGNSVSPTSFAFADELQKTFFDLVMAASKEVAPDDGFVDRTEVTRILGKVDGRSRESHRFLPEKLGKAIMALNELIVPLGQEMYARGQRHAERAIDTISEIKQLVKFV